MGYVSLALRLLAEWRGGDRYGMGVYDMAWGANCVRFGGEYRVLDQWL